jgi:cytochrome b6-f complex iron-sulfur subunit
VRVFGPAPRSMDRMEITIDGSGNIEVNTGAITKGTPDNNAFAVQG